MCSVAQSCPIFCDPMDGSHPGFSVHGILQARILEWVAIPFSRGPSRLRDQTWVSCFAGGFSTIWATREAPGIGIIEPQITGCLGNPMNRGAWGATVHGVTKGLYDFATEHIHMVRTFKLYSFSKFQVYNTVLLTVVTMRKIWFSEVIYLITKKFIPFDQKLL